MEEIQLKIKTDYQLTKVHEDGTFERKTIGPIHNPEAVIKIGWRVIVGRGLSDVWNTSPVIEIEKIHNGVKFETENSTYILQEWSK